MKDIKSGAQDVSTGGGVSRRGFLGGAAGAVATVGIAGPLLAACSSSKGTTANKKTLTLMVTTAFSNKTFFNDILQGIGADPLKVKLNIVTVADATAFNQIKAAQDAGKAPDLIMFTAQAVPAFPANGIKIQNLNSYVSSEDKSKFFPQDYQANSIGSDILGVGVRCQCRGLAYRADYAQAAGLSDPPASWSFDEFGAFVSKLNKGSKQIGFGYEAKVGDGRSSSNILPLIYSTGSPLVKQEAGKWVRGFTKDQIQQVLTFYYDAVHTWKSTPSSVANWGYPETDGYFSKGLLASYSAGIFVKANSAQYPTTLKNIKFAPLPHISKQASFFEEHNMQIHADSKNKDLAWQFISNLRTEKGQKAISTVGTDAQLAVRLGINDSLTDPISKSLAALLPSAVVPEAVNVGPLLDKAILPAIEQVSLGTSPGDAATKLITNFDAALTTVNS